MVAELPKSRSGKIMRQLLRDVAENRTVGDVTTLADTSVMDQITIGLRAATDARADQARIRSGRFRSDRGTARGRVSR